MVQRFGFCCKWLNNESEFGGMKVNAKDRDLNGRSTTMRWLREHPEDAVQRQWDIMNHNATAARKSIIQRLAANARTPSARNRKQRNKPCTNPTAAIVMSAYLANSAIISSYPQLFAIRF